MADEPTGDLDAKSATEILDLMGTLNRDFKKTIVMVTHDPRAAERAHDAAPPREGRPSGLRAEAAMKFLPYLLKHLRRNWFRTTLTVLAMALCIFLFCTLQSVLAAINGQLEATSAKRLVTRNSVSIVFDLPHGLRGADPVRARRQAGGDDRTGSAARCPAKKEGKADEGDTSSTTDWSNFFPNLAVELEPYFAMYPEYQVPPDQWQALPRGPARLRRSGGSSPTSSAGRSATPSTSRASSRRYRKADGPFEFVVRAIFDTDPVKYPGTDTNLMLFSRKYLYEATGRHAPGRDLLGRDRRPGPGGRR